MIPDSALGGRALVDKDGFGLKRLGFLLAFIVSISLSGRAFADDLDDLLAEGDKSAKKPKIPIFVIPFQPVWKMADVKTVGETFTNVSSEFRQAGFDLKSYDLRVDAKPYDDPAPRLGRIWARDLRRAETYTQKLRFRLAKREASKVVRQILQNAEHLRDPKLLCRGLALVAEAELRRSRARRA